MSAAAIMPTGSSRPRTKPILRGVSHEIAAFASVPAWSVLIGAAGDGAARVAAATYGACLVTLFTVSAVYHRPRWSPRVRTVIGRCDNSAIFLLIAGTYTPFGLLLGPGRGHALLTAIWIGAALGIVLSLAWERAPKPPMAALYVALGWMVVPVLPALRAAVGDESLRLLLVGGLVYTAGAVVYALRSPDPFPGVFGYHEIFHLLVIAAAACHFIVVFRVIRLLAG